MTVRSTIVLVVGVAILVPYCVMTTENYSEDYEQSLELEYENSYEVNNYHGDEIPAYGVKESNAAGTQNRMSSLSTDDFCKKIRLLANGAYYDYDEIESPRVLLRSKNGIYYYVYFGSTVRTSMLEKVINRNMDWKVMTHGFTPNEFFGGFNGGSCKKVRDERMFLMAEEYFRKNNSYNIMIFDWTELSSFSPYNYDTAAENTGLAAKMLRGFLLAFYGLGFISDMEQVHLIGFSLGAHVMGQAGELTKAHFQSKTAVIGRITGLDPAGPYFQDEEEENQCTPINNALTKSAAKFVDVSHCNMDYRCFYSHTSGFFSGAGYGTGSSNGDVNFVVNGGVWQPGCDAEDLTTIEKNKCSHNKCVHYFIQSIHNNYTIIHPGYGILHFGDKAKFETL